MTVYEYGVEFTQLKGVIFFLQNQVQQINTAVYNAAVSDTGTHILYGKDFVTPN